MSVPETTDPARDREDGPRYCRCQYRPNLIPGDLVGLGCKVYKVVLDHDTNQPHLVLEES